MTAVNPADVKPGDVVVTNLVGPARVTAVTPLRHGVTKVEFSTGVFWAGRSDLHRIGRAR